ncbi:hypothetical protein Patl1_07748 [Pistacia atlantica]|uniref:Uncharacterized protein n=1 Tax=Pistacia atlantica TaxID=434234 RepID=A0ACC1AD73_9ROSI|nr:hypothetical protein Patl1_07748 [Pistacia atlantica]
MCFPGSEIPDWFNIQSCGSFIELPQGSFNHKFLGLVFCAIVGVQNHNHSYKGDYHMQIEYELHSKCKDGYNGVSKKLFSVNEPKNIESDHIFLGYNCNTFDFREFSYNTEAIINFSCNKFCLCKITKHTKDNISSQAKIYLKKCGIRLLYTQEFEEPMKRSRCPVFGKEEEQEEVQSKRLKPSKFFKGESGSRSGVHLLPHKKEGEEFSPTTNEPISFTLFDLDEFPGDFIASPISISDPDEDNDGDLVKSQPFTSLDLDDFPQDSVSSPIIIISDSDKDNDG